MEEMKAAGISISNVVCLALGTFHGASGARAPSSREETFENCFSGQRSGGQLVLALMVREVLGDEGTPLPCIVQDPDFSALDKEFLRSLDVTAVDDPDAFTLINSTSLVMEVGGFNFLYEWIAQGTWPAAIICYSLNQTSRNGMINSMVEAFRREPGIVQTFEEVAGYSLYFREDTGHPANPSESAAIWTRDGGKTSRLVRSPPDEA